MAKVTLVIEDIEAAGGFMSVTISGDFDQPGKSYEEMTSNPTLAVSLGLQLIASATSEADNCEGKMEDEFGNTLDLSK
jgi:hypothetical protein